MIARCEKWLVRQGGSCYWHLSTDDVRGDLRLTV